ncbi:MAG: hypothetical protein PHG64_14425 [Paludibacter sp.]|nr:hypothetical protein [Paludibacter sp.]
MAAKKPTTKKTTAKKPKPKAPEVEIVDSIPVKDEKAELLPYNPLLGSNVVTVHNELDMKIDAINEIESLAELNRQQLMAKRQRVELEVDNKKLDTAKKTISTIEKIIESVANEEVLERVTANINTAQDMKYMAEAAEKLTNTLRNLMNPNVADELGNKKRHKINFMFKSSGAVQAAVQVETSDD